MVRSLQAFAIVAVLSLLAVGCSGGDGGDGGSDAEPTPEPMATAVPGPELALRNYAEMTLGKPYLAECPQSNAGEHAGKVCSAHRGDRNNQRAYVMGNTFSEANLWVIVEERNGVWQVAHTQVITRDNAAVPGIPWPLALGVDIVVVGAAPCVNVREGPSLGQRAVDSICDGTRIRLGAGPATGDNFQWWQIAGRSGWVVADFLRYPDAAQ